MNKKHLFVFSVVLISVILLFYGRTFYTWFQQDEWDWIGRYTYFNSISKIPLWEAFKSSLFPHPRYRFAPLFDAFYAGLVSMFGLKFELYSILSLLIHLLNSILIFVLAEKLSKNNNLSFLISILFATGSIGQKAVTWVATSFNTQPSFTFSIIAIIALIDYIKNKSSLINIFIFGFIALWFKENALGVILFFPIISLILDKSKKKIKKIIYSTVIFLIFYFVLRFLLSRIGLRIHTEGYSDFGRFLNIWEYMGLVFWTPIRSVVDVFVFPYTLIAIASFFHGTHDLYAENTGVNIVTISILPFILFSAYLIYKKIVLKNKWLKNLFFMAIVIIFVSTITSSLLAIRGTSALVYIIRSRDLYFSTAGAAIIIAIPIYKIMKQKKTIFKVFAIFLLGIYFSYHYTNINKRIINGEIQKRNQREITINNVYSFYPNISNKSIFYSDEMPFQTGFGRTLLVWYVLNGDNRFINFLKDDYLYFPGSTGYKEMGKYGFGYIKNIEEVKKVVKEYQLSADNVYSFSYDKQTNLIENKTQVIRNLLQSL